VNNLWGKSDLTGQLASGSAWPIWYTSVQLSAWTPRKKRAFGPPRGKRGGGDEGVNC